MGPNTVSNNGYFLSEVKVEQQKEERDLLESLVNVELKFSDLHLQLIQSFVEWMPFHSETVLLLALICQKYGWEPFATTIADKFKTTTKKEQVFSLSDFDNSEWRSERCRKNSVSYLVRSYVRWKRKFNDLFVPRCGC